MKKKNRLEEMSRALREALHELEDIRSARAIVENAASRATARARRHMKRGVTYWDPDCPNWTAEVKNVRSPAHVVSACEYEHILLCR